MAYINRKKFAEKIAKCSAFNRQGFEFEGNLLQGVVLDLIEAEPTADVAEVKHGEWIEEKGESYLVHPMKYDDNGEPILQEYISYKCSLCGRIENNKEPYCNCGAKMDGGKRNDL